MARLRGPHSRLVGVLGALVLASSVGCTPSSSSLQSIVEEMASSADSDLLAGLEAESVPGEGLRVTASFVLDNGEAEQYRKLPSEDLPHSLGAPVPSVVLSAAPLAEVDLAGLEARMADLADCERPRGQLFIFEGHVAENVRCHVDGPPHGRLDGAPVEVIPAGNLPEAAKLMQADAQRLSATQVGRVAIGMTPEQVWFQLQVVSPSLPRSASVGPSDDDSTRSTGCHLLMTRSAGSFFPVCELVLNSAPVRVIDPHIITKIWRAEGSPTHDWRLELIGEGEDALWRVYRGQGNNDSLTYGLDGQLRDG